MSATEDGCAFTHRNAYRRRRTSALAAVGAIAALATGTVLTFRGSALAPKSDPGALGGRWRSVSPRKAGGTSAEVEISPGTIVVDGKARNADFLPDGDKVTVSSPGPFEGTYRIVDRNMATSAGAVLMRLAR